MNSTKQFTFGFTVLLISLLFISSFAYASTYSLPPQSSSLTIPPNGTLVIDQNSTTGLTITVNGVPGANGTVTTQLYLGNPQPTANIPANVTLTHFVDISFNLTQSDFNNATVVFHYTAAEVANFSLPYAIYKYLPSNNTYTPLATEINVASQTMSVTLTSLNDPLLCFGNYVLPSSIPTPTPTLTGTPTSSPTASSTASPQPTVTPAPQNSTPVWVWIVVVVVVIVVIVVAAIWFLRMREGNPPVVLQ